MVTIPTQSATEVEYLAGIFSLQYFELKILLAFLTLIVMISVINFVYPFLNRRGKR